MFGGFKWDVAKKNVLLDKVSEMFVDIEWIYDKKGDLKKENFDASDSAVCVLGYINKVKYNELSPVVEIKNENDKYIEYDVKIWDKIFTHRIAI